MNIKELVGLAKEAAPDLANMPDARAARLLRVALSLIAAEIDSIDQGVVKVVGLGNFRVRQLEREQGSGTERVRRVLFRSAQGFGAKAGAPGR